jgi:cell division initiation protein
MRITPLDVHEQTFRMAFRGFDPSEVDAFLQRVADELERLTEERDRCRAELEAEKKTRKTLEETLSALRSLQGNILENARREADLLQNQAQLRSDRILAEANEELLRLRREVQGLAEKRRLRLAELSALAATLDRWVQEKLTEPVEGPELIAEPAETIDPGGPEVAEEREGIDAE